MNILSIDKNILSSKSTSSFIFANGTISVLGRIYEFHLFYKHIKTATINFSNNIIEVILPNKFKKLSTDNILKISTEIIYDKIAKKEVEQVMEKTRLLLGFAPEDYIIKRLYNGQMGLCYTKEKKIVINPDIVKYDRRTIEYIILHQFCHLKYKTHSKGFWQMMKKYMPNYEQFQAVAA